MQCPACGATSPDSAAWCGQCYRRFDQEVPEAAAQEPSSNGSTAEGVAAPVAAPTAAAPAAAAPPATSAGAPDAAAPHGFRRVGDELEWECPECASFNGIELTSCAICGTSFLQRFRSDEPEPERNWQAALLLSAVAPGAGHLSVGRYGTGGARLLLFVAWILGSVLLASSAGSGALIAATPLVLGALILWAMTLFDIYRLQHGESEILAGRTFLWLVVGVLLLMGVALFGSAGTAVAPG